MLGYYINLLLSYCFMPFFEAQRGQGRIFVLYPYLLKLVTVVYNSHSLKCRVLNSEWSNWKLLHCLLFLTSISREVSSYTYLYTWEQLASLVATFWNNPVARFPKALGTDHLNKNVVPTCEMLQFFWRSERADLLYSPAAFSEHLFPVCIHKDFLLLC